MVRVKSEYFLEQISGIVVIALQLSSLRFTDKQFRALIQQHLSGLIGRIFLQQPLENADGIVLHRCDDRTF